MKPNWQAIVDAIAKWLAANSALQNAAVLSLVILAIAIPLSLVLKLRTYRARIGVSATFPPTDLGDAVKRLPAEAEGAQTLTDLLKNFGGSIKVSKTVTVGEPTIVRMDGDVLQKAQSLQAAGKDLDSICRELHPEYSSWGPIEQEVFRMTMEAVLKSQR